MILLNDFKRLYQEIKNEISEAVTAVGESGWLILGKEVAAFEETIQSVVNAKAAVGVASGLDALEIALRTLGIGPQVKVLTTPLSAFATTLAILKVGAKPVFVDVDETGLIDLEEVSSALNRDPSIRCFIPVHLYGHAMNLDELKKLKRKYGIFIIEDCAQAILAQSNGQPVGNVGDIAAYSLYPTKNLGCFGDGGFATTSNHDYAEKMKCLRDYGQTTKYEHTLLGLNSRLDELHAAILNRALLPKLNAVTQQRKKIAKTYLEKIKNSQIQLPKIPKGSDSVWHLFPILSDARNDLQRYLANQGIQTAVHYPKLICDQPALQNYQGGYDKLGELSYAKKFVNCELSLPLNPFLTNDEVEKVIIACNEWRK